MKIIVFSVGIPLIKAHSTDKVKEEAKNKKIDLGFVPGVCTGIQQT